MSLRLYLAPRSTTGRIHCILRDIVPGLPFEEIRNDADLVGLCLVNADNATHATLAADPRVTPLTGTEANAQTLLAALAGQPTATVRTVLDGYGIAAGLSLREAVKALGREFWRRDALHRGLVRDTASVSVRFGALEIT